MQDSCRTISKVKEELRKSFVPRDQKSAVSHWGNGTSTLETQQQDNSFFNCKSLRDFKTVMQAVLFRRDMIEFKQS